MPIKMNIVNYNLSITVGFKPQSVPQEPCRSDNNHWELKSSLYPTFAELPEKRTSKEAVCEPKLDELSRLFKAKDLET